MTSRASADRWRRAHRGATCVNRRIAWHPVCRDDARITEADNSTVSYTYNGIGRLTGETRTGTNAFTASYTLDGVGNRTSQTVGGSTTSFTLNADDELTATSGGFTNSYSYNANGEQTGRTLGGTAYSLSYDYDGQLTQITQGQTSTDFAYDAPGRRFSRTAGGQWSSADGTVRLRYTVRRTIAPDSFGLFFLTAPVGLFEPGRPAEIEVRAPGNGSKRWFALAPYRDAASREAEP